MNYNGKGFYSLSDKHGQHPLDEAMEKEGWYHPRNVIIEDIKGNRISEWKLMSKLVNEAGCVDVVLKDYAIDARGNLFHDPRFRRAYFKFYEDVPRKRRRKNGSNDKKS